jgi:hypothetical protein
VYQLRASIEATIPTNNLTIPKHPLFVVISISFGSHLLNN